MGAFGTTSDRYSDRNNTQESDFKYYHRRGTVESNGTTVLPDAAYNVNSIPNKGPLLTIAIALFGPESFIADRVMHPENYFDPDQDLNVIHCFDRAPFVPLLSVPSTHDDLSVSNNLIQGVCNRQWNLGQLQSDILTYVQMFIGIRTWIVDSPSGPDYDKRLNNAFEAAAFLANEQWLTAASKTATLMVSYDPGEPTQVPHISKAGIILISCLLGIYLAGLLATAVYSSWAPRWASRLDSLVMMQYGAAVADQLSMKVIADSQLVKVLDETPGWLGDASGEGDLVGELRLGARTPLRAKRRYICFEHDHETSPERKTRPPASHEVHSGSA